MNILACEDRPSGWRGLTSDGEVLDVKAERGGAPEMVHVGNRQIYLPDKIDGCVADYLEHFERARTLLQKTAFAQCLREIDKAIDIAPTARARFLRSLALLHCGFWTAGLREYETHHAYSQMPSWPLATRWSTQDIRGRALVLQHSAGFGDTIMCLRYVPMLQAMGADVFLDMPDELGLLAAELAPLADYSARIDYHCPIFSLPYRLKQLPGTIPTAPYLKVNPLTVEYWRERLPPCDTTRIGIAWNIGKMNDGDYPRQVPLALLIDGLIQAAPNAQLYSVQAQNGDEARRWGVNVHPFNDFADCAAFMMCMDCVVSVDTAALHLAGAIGHPRVIGLLSHWHSWRWRAWWYPQIQWAVQSERGYWMPTLDRLRDLLK